MQDRIRSRLDRLTTGQSCEFTVRRAREGKPYYSVLRCEVFPVDFELVDTTMKVIHNDPRDFQIEHASVRVLPAQRAADNASSNTTIVEHALLVRRRK